MNPSKLQRYLKFAFETKRPVLVKGKPGIGKTDIILKVAQETGADVILDHPVISDPTDFKGLPFAEGNQASFLPFKNLLKAIKADKPTIYFADDLGQASATVQAAFMQLLLARQIGEHKVSEHVVFFSATNRREDKAGVSGFLEPVKSRFLGGIVELEVSTDDWVKWAIENNMPTELIAFIKFKPQLLEQFNASKDLVNSPSPRTVAAIGRLQNDKLDEDLRLDVFTGVVGAGFASEYIAFLKLYKGLPSIDAILKNPYTAPLPIQPGAMYAISGALAHKANFQTIKPILVYLDRLPSEISISCIKEGIIRTPTIASTPEFIQWSKNHKDELSIN